MCKIPEDRKMEFENLVTKGTLFKVLDLETFRLGKIECPVVNQKHKPICGPICVMHVLFFRGAKMETLHSVVSTMTPGLSGDKLIERWGGVKGCTIDEIRKALEKFGFDLNIHTFNAKKGHKDNIKKLLDSATLTEPVILRCKPSSSVELLAKDAHFVVCIGPDPDKKSCYLIVDSLWGHLKMSNKQLLQLKEEKEDAEKKGQYSYVASIVNSEGEWLEWRTYFLTDLMTIKPKKKSISD